MHSYAIKLHKVSGTKSGTNQGRDKAGQHPCPAPDYAAWRGAGQAGQLPVFQTRRGVCHPPRLRLHKIRDCKIYGSMLRIAVVAELGNQCKMQNVGRKMQFAVTADSDQLFHARD
ncbi:hypothetical protein JL1_15 [Escherichia phage JL1]|uniref:Uncharacterized protein n=1 Tax=Escherichia phage JL1 TaxID=2681620 RepID=K4NXB5_9CAUD|nr:hypothetical protein D873_gp15 [Escherichia phage JL1]AFV51291.1 hypothetical protein JL1_15 [Escherichia phage JL1]